MANENTKTREGIDALLSAINALVDNAGEWTSADVKEQAQAIQRMSANLPILHRIAVQGWESARHLAIADNHPATERRANAMLCELGDDL